MKKVLFTAVTVLSLTAILAGCAPSTSAPTSEPSSEPTTSVEPTTDPTTATTTAFAGPKSVGLIGSFAASNWETEVEFTSSDSEGKVWKLDNYIFYEGDEWKVRANDAWDWQWSFDNLDESSAALFENAGGYGNVKVLSTAYYSITVDAANDVVSVTKGEDYDPFAGLVGGAIEALQGDLKITVDVTAKRDFINPFYSNNNFERTTRVSYSFDSGYNDEFIISETTLYSLVADKYQPSQTVRVVYNKDTNVVHDELLSYKNEVFLAPQSNANGVYNVVGSASLGYNYALDFTTENCTLSDDGTYVTYEGKAFTNLIASTFGAAPVMEEAIINIEDGKFTSFTVNFATQKDMYISTSGEGATYYQTYTLNGGFSYGDIEIAEKTPSTGEKVAAIDNVLAQYVDKSYTVQPINPDLKEDGAGVQVIYNGDQIAIDVMDYFSEELELGTLSWLDSKFVKDAEGDKYHIENLALDEETYEFKWLSTEEVVGSVTDKYIEESVSFTKDQFKLDFTSIDSSLFTLKEGSENVYEIKEDAAKYFGECIVPTICDYSSVLADTGMHLSQYTNSADSWTVEIVDDTTLYFECSAIYDFGGALARGSWGFYLCNPGTSDTAPFYSADLPSLM